MDVLEVAGQQTRLADVGVGDPVVVLHGWGGRLEAMAPVLDCLAGHFRVVSLDLPGFGDSPAPTRVWGTADYADYLCKVLDELGVERTHAVGHSFGGRIALHAAAAQPERLDRIVVVGASGVRRAASGAVRAKRMLSRAAKVVGALGPPGRAARNALHHRIASQDYKDAGPLRPILVKVVNEDLSPLLPRIRSSTLLVWGANDDAVPLELAKRMERLIPDCGLVVFEGAGHFAYLDDPGRFCRVVRHFFGAPVR